MKISTLLIVLAAVAAGVLAVPAAAQAPVSDALLRLEDLPAGWSEEPVPQGNGSNHLCDVPPPLSSTDTLDSAESAFSRGIIGPFLVQYIGRAADVASRMAAIRALPVPCEWSGSDGDGDQTAWQLRAISFPSLGDDSVAFRLTGTLEGGGFVLAEVVYIRTGDVLAAISLLSAGLFLPPDPDTALLESLARTVAERMAALE